MQWLLIVLALAAGFYLLFKGADWMVDGAGRIARRLGISILVIGLTVVAFGTSAPEIVVSGLAAQQGKPDLALGNILGSNVANIGLVLGSCALVLPSVLQTRLAFREIFWLFASLGVFGFVSWDRSIVRWEAGLLLGVFVLYNASLFVGPKPVPEEVPRDPHPKDTPHPLLLAGAGIAAIVAGAWLVVWGAERGALAIGIPRSVVGLTVVAVGTSLPELAAGLGGALKGEKDISLGNVIGSNVFNVLAVMGIVGIVQPLDASQLSAESAESLERAFGYVMREDLWVALGFSVLAVVLPLMRGGGRVRGGVLLALYVGYCAWLVSSGRQM